MNTETNQEAVKKLKPVGKYRATPGAPLEIKSDYFDYRKCPWGDPTLCQILIHFIDEYFWINIRKDSLIYDNCPHCQQLAI